MKISLGRQNVTGSPTAAGVVELLLHITKKETGDLASTSIELTAAYIIKILNHCNLRDNDSMLNVCREY